AAHYAEAESSIVFDIDLKRLFNLLLSGGLRDFPDPRFPSDGYLLKACNTELQRQDALSKLANAARWASEAVEHRLADRTVSAFNRWNLIFNYHFPSYSII